MRVKTYPILVSCLERGILSGLYKAEKRGYLQLTERQEEQAAEQVQQYVMNEVCEVFDWDDEVSE